MTRLGIAALTGVLGLSSGPQAQAPAATRFRARLSPVPITAQQASTIRGVGTVTATLAGTKLSVTGTFEGLSGPATAARLHRGPRTGVRGPVLFDLQVSTAISGTVGGTFELTPQQVEDLRRERFYIQLHSEPAPDGNLWGWLLPQETPR